MRGSTEHRQGGHDQEVAVFPSELAAIVPATQQKNDHQDETREELLTELEIIEQRLTDQTEELRQTTLQLALAEQRERDRLAGILHDDLQQLLLAAKWNLQSLKKQLRRNQQLRNELNDAIHMVDRSIQMSRSLSRELSPPGLDSGLLPALSCLVDHFRQAYGFEVRLAAEGKFLDIPDALRDFLFHAIRELLVNAAKHSNRTQAELRLRQGKKTIQVSVSDKGVGFEPHELDRMLARGSGLVGIWSRTARMGGQLKIETSQGGGATFRISVPWPLSE